MDLFYKYAEMIDEGGITTEIIANAIIDHATMQSKTMNNYGRYQLETANTPILTRTFTGEAANKINNQLANDYFGEIVDTKVGYMFGLPVGVSYDKKAQSSEQIMKKIEHFKKANNFDDFNAELCKFSAICGYDSALCYIDKDGQERVMRINPWEAIVISKTSVTEPEYGIVYYKTWENEANNYKARVEFYDGNNVTIFEGASFSAEALSEVSAKPHMFKYCPLYGIPNNAELQGDGDKVFSLIDGFDRSISDMNSEIEQFRLAYILYIGYEPEEGQIAEMMKTGALWIPSAENGEDIKWLIKDLNPAYPDSHLDRLEANITRFAKHVNFTDAAFGGDITGPAMRYKLFALETKSKYFERKHDAATLYMFKVLGSAWETKGIPFDYTLLDLVYTRNIPVNLLDEAQTATTLSGITSHKTALSVLSIVKDPETEMAAIEQEAAASQINLDNPNLKVDANGNPIGPNNKGGVM